MEKELSEIDSAIFAFLSYADFTSIFDKEKMSIQDIGRKYLGFHLTEKNNNIIAVKEACNLLKYIKDTKRFRNCFIYNYKYEGTSEIQFGAISIEYKKNEVYVSFEGTDELISGWSEDLRLSYEFPTKSHKKAIEYLNRYFTFSNKKIIVGGHSKGGNLALVAGAYANFFVRSKIKKIYNFDGPGLLEKEFLSKQFQDVIKKYVHIIPDYSVVGLLLGNTNTKVVKSKNKTILSHNIYYWEIANSSFVESTLSTFSNQLKDDIDNWIIQYSDEEKRDFVENFEEVCKNATVNSLLDFKEKKTKVLDFIYSSKNFNDKSRRLLLDFFTIILKGISNITKEEIKEILNRKIHIPKRIN